MAGEKFLTEGKFDIFAKYVDLRFKGISSKGLPYVQVVSGGGSGGGGLDKFVNLTDVPSSYSSKSLRYVRVNTTETALEFGPQITISADEPSGGEDGDIWLKTGSVSISHGLLSTTHTDSYVNSPLRGALITGQGASPVWRRLEKGTSGYFFKAGASDVDWSLITQADVDGLKTTSSPTFAALTVTAGFGCNGASPQTAYALPANATDLDTAKALANALKSALIAIGICSA